MRPTDRRVRTWAGKNFACPRSVATACSGALSSASTKIVAHRSARAQEPPKAKKNQAAAQLGRRGGKDTAQKLNTRTAQRGGPQSGGGPLGQKERQKNRETGSNTWPSVDEPQ